MSTSDLRQVANQVVKVVEERGGKSERVEHRVEEARIAQIGEGCHRSRCGWADRGGSSRRRIITVRTLIGRGVALVRVVVLMMRVMIVVVGVVRQRLR